MTTALTPTPNRSPRRRERQKDQTRLDLALAAFEQAKAHGLAGVRVPQVAAAVGVSTRTFNNYFPSKEAAVAFPATLRAGRLAASLAERPPDEPLTAALIAAVTIQYGAEIEGLPAGWLQDFRALAVTEPALQGEFLKAAAAAETALADAIARRTGAAPDDLEPQVLAAVVIGTERAAVRHWARQQHKPGPLTETVSAAIGMALRGTPGH
jgi:AcrR family transcriptional regulator